VGSKTRLASAAAVIGNPPYVRQEDIKSYKPKGKENPKRGTKEYYRALVSLCGLCGYCRLMRLILNGQTMTGLLRL
jgi:hypothetical protein